MKLPSLLYVVIMSVVYLQHHLDPKLLLIAKFVSIKKIWLVEFAAEFYPPKKYGHSNNKVKSTPQ